MTNKILALVLGALFTIPCVLRADEVEIPLMEVVQIETFPGDAPLDDAEHIGQTSIPQETSVYIYNIQGQHLMNVNYSKEWLSKLPAGIYIFKEHGESQERYILYSR